MDKKLTDNEIVKALEHCASGKMCFNCPFKHITSWRDECAKFFLDLINRQNAENERLTIRLRKVEHQLDDLCKMHHIIKAEAYKEFAERLKKEHFLADEHDIDNLLKELVGEDNG